MRGNQAPNCGARHTLWTPVFWTSSAEARSKHGACRQDAAGIICASVCLWLELLQPDTIQPPTRTYTVSGSYYADQSGGSAVLGAPARSKAREVTDSSLKIWLNRAHAVQVVTGRREGHALWDCQYRLAGAHRPKNIVVYDVLVQVRSAIALTPNMPTDRNGTYQCTGNCVKTTLAEARGS